MKKFFVAVAFIFILLFHTSCEKTASLQPIKESRFLLDTIVDITLYGTDKETRPILDKLFREIENDEKKFSRHQSDGEIGEVNNHIGEEVTVSEDTINMVESAFSISTMTGGLFDISIGPLVDLWDISGNEPCVPTEEEIQSVLKKINYRKIDIDVEKNTLSIPDEGMSLDMGAIAKGYITDKLVKILQEDGIQSALLNLGGNLYLYGSKPDGALWNIGIRNPYGLQGEYIGTVMVKDMSVVTSGIYERYFEVEEKRYHHILNPKTGYPEDNTLASVSILSPSSTFADGLSTAVFLLGRKDGMSLIEKINDVEAIFVTKDRKVYLSSGLKSGKISFTLTDKDFMAAN